MWANQSRDAKFCVSQARMRNKQVRNMAVNTAVDTRETQGWHRIQVRILPGIAVFIARETQNLASLLGWRHHYKCWKRQDVICGLTKVETQNFASHKQGCAINWGDYVPVITASFARETQDFASLLGWRHHYFNTKKCASVCDSVLHISPPALPYPITLFLSSRADASSAIR